MSIDEVFILETKMWEAAKARDRNAFLELVDEDAVMVCGGYQCTGKEYADVIENFDCRNFSIDYIEIVHEDINSIQVHYQITTEVNDIRNMDLSGSFHVTTTWARKDEKWVVVFNMDQKIIEN